jgi:hypothetical protein
MTEKIIDRIFDFDKISTKLIVLVWAITGLLLFIPSSVLDKVRLTEFLVTYGMWVGIAFVFSTGFLFVTLYTYLTTGIANRRHAKRLKEGLIDWLKNLDDHEKAVLREFIIKSSYTLQLPMDNSAVIGLESKRIIFRVSDTGFTYFSGAYYHYTLNKVAMEEIIKNRNIIGMPKLETGLTQADQQAILNSRPQWAFDKDQQGII